MRLTWPVLLCFAATLGAAEHPRLWFDKSDLPALQQKVKDPSMQALWTKVQEAALRPPKDFDIRGVEAAGMAYNITGDAKFARPAIQTLMRLAKDASWPTRKGTGGGQIKWCGLETGTNCKVLGAGYDLLYQAMTDDERRTIREALVQRVWPKYLAAFEKESRGHPVDADGHYEWWTDTYCNWAAWLTGGVGVSALALYDEEPLAKEVLEKVNKGFAAFRAAYNQKPEDGGCDEGPMYWGTSFSHSVFFHAALERVTGNDQGFFKSVGVACAPHFVADYTAPDGRLVAFGDCSFITPSFVPAELFLVANRCHQPGAAWYADTYRPSWYEQSFGILWRNAGPTPPPPAQGDVRWYRDVEYALFRTPNLYVPFKGGDLGANHVQYDAGTFLVYAGSDRLLADPGYGKVETAMHNTLLVDGKGQRRLEGFRGTDPTAATAKIELCTKAGPDRYLACDVSPCYAEPLKRFRRHLVVTDEDYVILFDELAATKPVTFSLLLQSDKKMAAESGFHEGAQIESGAAKAFVTVLAEGGSRNSVGKSAAGTGLTAANAAPRTDWRAFTILAARAASAPAVKAEFAAGKATLTVAGQAFVFEERSGKYVYVPRSGTPAASLAGICPGEGGEAVASAPGKSATVPGKTPAATPAKPAAPTPATAPAAAFKDEDLKAWVGKLQEMVLARVAAGEKPRAYLKVFGGRAESVKIIDAGPKQLTLDVKGNRLPVAWEQVADREACLSLAQAFFKEGQAEDAVLLAVFLFANGRNDEGEEQLARAIAADPEGGRAAALEIRGAMGGP
ncbi:MAG: heparinase II/III family protein [Planctomycetota bacterium]|nr:heparinase II/III family protein [Planctomycetota bacterium]